MIDIDLYIKFPPDLIPQFYNAHLVKSCMGQGASDRDVGGIRKIFDKVGYSGRNSCPHLIPVCVILDGQVIDAMKIFIPIAKDEVEYFFFQFL